MLQLIDQKWREHLSEMDYLREGIGLRAMGQQDPLVAWQREGYEMFGQLMSSIDDDYVKIVMHAQVQVLDEGGNEPQLAGATYQGPEGPQEDGFARVLAAGPAPGEEVVFASAEEGAAAIGGNVGGSSGARSRANEMESSAIDVMQPVIKTNEFDHVGRNDACPCGSGKKFKFCHGRA
jgi:preprotein translocase subunit SecA